jgi:adenosylhomocysteine nucleosidase
MATVGLVFAMPVEADAFERLVENRRETHAARFVFHSGRLAGRDVAWCVAGVGGESAAAATEHLVSGHRPGVVIAAGFAGGLVPGLQRGTVVRPGRVVSDTVATAFELAGAMTDGAASTIVSVATVAATADAKRELALRTAAQVVDMETHAIAGAAAAAGVPCECLRVISDDASDSLPPEVAGLASARSSLRRLGLAVGAIGRRPAALADFWRLWERAVVDSRTIATAVAERVRDLP